MKKKRMSLILPLIFRRLMRFSMIVSIILATITVVGYAIVTYVLKEDTLTIGWLGVVGLCFLFGFIYLIFMVTIFIISGTFVFITICLFLVICGKDSALEPIDKWFDQLY